MKLKHLLFAAPAALLMLGCGTANAGQTINEAGALVCVTDKWDETEIEKGHKLADWVGRCVGVPDNPAAPKYTEDCVVKYEFMPDESWKATGSCTWNFKDGEKVYDTIEEGSHLKEPIFKITGGTGKYDGASGGGTYSCETLTPDTLCGGRFKGAMHLP
ncbi:MAG TPA: hypothetical protein VFR71_08490 [Methyloceanibacter sp.]|nr:hypothetical protein [Methyloceanibacter sp.]